MRLWSSSALIQSPIAVFSPVTDQSRYMAHNALPPSSLDSYHQYLAWVCSHESSPSPDVYYIRQPSQVLRKEEKGRIIISLESEDTEGIDMCAIHSYHPQAPRTYPAPHLPSGICLSFRRRARLPQRVFPPPFDSSDTRP